MELCIWCGYVGLGGYYVCVILLLLLLCVWDALIIVLATEMAFVYVHDIVYLFEDILILLNYYFYVYYICIFDTFSTIHSHDNGDTLL